MARKRRNIGPETLGLIEAAPIEAILEVLEYDSAGDAPVLADFVIPDVSVEADAFRSQLIDNLDKETPDSLVPLEDRCRRIMALSGRKGPASLDTLVGQRLSHEENDEYADRPDELCRSIWVFLNHQTVFEDAEAFHAARQYRDFGKMYDAFEVDIEDQVALDAASIDEAALAERITERLKLPSRCTVRSVNLPKTRAHPSSVMLIVRHPGPLSSVFSHKDSGLKGTIYYRPPNEATLIWTSKTRQLEICAQSPAVRQDVAAGFAEVVLGQDLSAKPLTWRRYDLTRFRKSLSLPIPQREDCEITAARLVEIELRLGAWSRRLALKVGMEDDITDIAKRYLGASDLFRRAEGFSRVVIAVHFRRPSATRKNPTLNISIGYNRCNLQSQSDPQARALGYELLDHWGILTAFRQLNDHETVNLLPLLLELHDLPDDDVSGGYLRERGVDPQRLIEAGLIEHRNRQNVILIDEDDHYGEVGLSPSTETDMVTATGLHGEDLGTRPAEDLLRYALIRDWLEETILKLIRPAVARPSISALDQDLIGLGMMRLDGADVPVHLARRLTQPETLRRLDVILRGRQQLGPGIVLAAGPVSLQHLGPNVVVRVTEHLDGDQPGVLSRDSLAQAFQAGRAMALGGASIALLKSGPQSAMLHIPGKKPLSVLSRNQIRIFEQLIAAHEAGSPEVRVGNLLADTGLRSPGDAFNSKSRASVVGHYLERGSAPGHWRLIVRPDT